MRYLLLVLLSFPAFAQDIIYFANGAQVVVPDGYKAVIVPKDTPDVLEYDVQVDLRTTEQILGDIKDSEQCEEAGGNWVPLYDWCGSDRTNIDENGPNFSPLP